MLCTLSSVYFDDMFFSFFYHQYSGMIVFCQYSINAYEIIAPGVLRALRYASGSACRRRRRIAKWRGASGCLWISGSAQNRVGVPPGGPGHLGSCKDLSPRDNPSHFSCKRCPSSGILYKIKLEIGAPDPGRRHMKNVNLVKPSHPWALPSTILVKDAHP